MSLPLLLGCSVLKQVEFPYKLLEKFVGVKPAVLFYFLPALNLSCHFRLALAPELADGRASRDMG